MQTRTHRLVAAAVAGLVLAPATSDSQVSELVIGHGGLDWRESARETVGLDTSVTEGLQPFAIDPNANIAVGPLTKAGAFTTVFGHEWGFSFAPPPTVEDKRPWVYGSRGQILSIDGDEDNPTDVAEVATYSYDLGLMLPINRVVFFPPEKGRTKGGGVTFENNFEIGSRGELFKDRYPRHYVVSVSANEAGFLNLNKAGNQSRSLGGRVSVSGTGSDDFGRIVEENQNHSQRIADVNFDTEFLRFFRVRFPVVGFIAEVQFFGEGFVPQTHYLSQLFDMGEPVNYGQLHTDFEVFRSPGFGLEPIPAPDADVKLEVEIRSGRDDSPLIHHVVTEIGTEDVVTEAKYNRTPGTYLGSGSQIAIPGQRGSVRDDVDNWSFWSEPHTLSGQDIQAPDGRQFVQVQAFITSSEPHLFGRLNSLAVEFSPLLANPVIGEVALRDQPQPTDGVVEVPMGEPLELTYDVRAGFTSDTQSGFNAIRLLTPEIAEFQSFEMGDPLVVVEPDSLRVDEEALIVFFPSHPVQPGANEPLRVTFSTRVFNFTTEFAGEVFQIGGENLAQSIDGGDATSMVSTNGLRVITPMDKLVILSKFALDSKVVTPNGDGVHDELHLSYSLHGVAAADVEVSVHDLSGRLVRRLVSETRSEGRYTERWDAQVKGRQVPPGTYLLHVAVDTDLGTFERTRTVAIAY